MSSERRVSDAEGMIQVVGRSGNRAFVQEVLGWGRVGILFTNWSGVNTTLLIKLWKAETNSCADLFYMSRSRD